MCEQSGDGFCSVRTNTHTHEKQLYLHGRKDVWVPRVIAKLGRCI